MRKRTNEQMLKSGKFRSSSLAESSSGISSSTDITDVVGGISEADLDLISYAVSNLRKSLDTIVSICPELKELDLDSPLLHNCDLKQARALSDPRMKLAQRIQRAARTGKNPFVEDVFSIQGAYSTMFGNTNTRMVHTRGTQDSDDGFYTNGLTELKSQPIQSSNSLCSSFSSFASTSASWPPPLPPIKNQHILNQVFTHKSAVNDKQHLTKQERLERHNERLEFLGDSVLNFTVSEIVYYHFPDAAEGDLSVIRSSLICNDTLWEWATMYGLDKRLKTKFEVTTEFEGKKSKIVADVLEAYIGGLYLDSPEGLALAQGWVQAMVNPIIDELRKERETIEPLDVEAKNMLYVLIGSAQTSPEYITVEEGSNETPYTVECRVGDEVIGRGTGPSIKAAGTRAAMMALKDKNLIRKYSEMRRNSPRATTHVSDNSAFASALVQSNKRPKVTKAEGTGPKNELYSLIGSASQRPIYHTRANGQNSYVSDVCMYDDLLGSGSGRTKKEAEQNAAQQALDNQELMNKWSKTKK